MATAAQQQAIDQFLSGNGVQPVKAKPDVVETPTTRRKAQAKAIDAFLDQPDVAAPSRPGPLDAIKQRFLTSAGLKPGEAPSTYGLAPLIDIAAVPVRAFTEFRAATGAPQVDESGNIIRVNPYTGQPVNPITAATLTAFPFAGRAPGVGAPLVRRPQPPRVTILPAEGPLALRGRPPLLALPARGGLPALERGPLPMGPTAPIPLGPIFTRRPRPLLQQPTSETLDLIRERMRMPTKRPSTSEAPLEVKGRALEGEVLDRYGRPVKAKPPPLSEALTRERDRLRSFYKRPIGAPKGTAEPPLEPSPTPTAPPPAATTSLSQRMLERAQKVEEAKGPPSRFEKTPTGMQGVIEEVGPRTMPKTPIRRGDQGVADLPLVQAGQKTVRQGEMVDPQRAAVQEWLTDQLGSGPAMSLAQAKSPLTIPPTVKAKLQRLGITPEDAWDVSHAAAPRVGTMERLVGLSTKEAAQPPILPTKGEVPVTPSPTVVRGHPFQRKEGFEHGIPNLRDPDDVYQLVQGAGRIKTTEGLTGELRDVSVMFKSGKGQTLDQIAAGIEESYPGLGDRGAIKEQLIDTLRRYAALKAEKRALGAKAKLEPDDPLVTEIRTGTPPGDIQIDPKDWTAMGPFERKNAVEFFRGILDDESGKLDLAKMMKALHSFRGKFPMETAVIKERPHSPVIAEVERWNTNNAEWIQKIAKADWWARGSLFKKEGVRQVNPELLKDAEAAAVREWQANGSTPQAALAARRHFPPDVQRAMRNRDGQLPHEQAARAYFGLEPIPKNPGPYLPRRVDRESREAVSLGGGPLGVGRGNQATMQTGVRGHGQERVFETYRDGERAGLVYEDPRNSILYREWEGIKLRTTARLFRNLEAKGGLFRDRQAAALQSPTGKPWRVENAPGGGTWWTATEAEAKFLQQNLTEAGASPFGSFVGYANGLLRNPNLINPAPHVVKNMAMKELLAQGPVSMSRVARDAVEWAKASNPRLLAEFREAMPFSDVGRTAGIILGDELRGVGVDAALRTAFKVLGMVNRPSQKVIFEWADPAMRYSLFKHYRNQGKGVYEAGNHAWVDLIRYGTRSAYTDSWKKIPFNFFVPWRFGTVVSLLKQVQNHPIRTGLLLAGIDYLREMRYRADGRWFHVPWDYSEKPIAAALQTQNPWEVATVIGTTALFGPGGEFGARQLDEAINVVRGKPNSFEWDRLKNAFWGISQLFGPGGAADSFSKGEYGNMLAGLMLGEHAAISYQPRRLMRDLPEWLPGMQRSTLVEQAEELQRRKKERVEKAAERRQDKPRSTIEDKLRAAGYLK